MTLVDIAIVTAVSLHFFSLGFICLYGAHCWLSLWRHTRYKKTMLARDQQIMDRWNPEADEVPFVSVQLPMYNEEFVVTRLIENIVRLDYPRDRFEIQILDDSTDGTTQIAQELAEKFSNQGFNIYVYHRDDRTGFKAGNLREAFKFARGEFIVVFDADFLPDPDFLQKTLPFFEDPNLAVVQTLWGHLNRDFSPLTIAQSLGLDGTNYVVQAARNWAGAMTHFQGTGGIWRKSAIEDAGGWQSDTLTEDLDLSYRAQIKGWKVKILPQVLCPGEIPTTIASAKTQQHRWSKGGFETAFKLYRSLMKSNQPTWVKIEALFHMFNYGIHPCILFIMLEWPIPLLVGRDVFQFTNLWVGGASLILGVVGPLCLSLYAQKNLYPTGRRGFRDFFYLLIYGVGIAVNNSKGVFEAFLGIKSDFVRTPKYGITNTAKSRVSRIRPTQWDFQVIVELSIAVFSLYGIVLLATQDAVLFNPFLVLFAASLGLIVAQSIWEPIQLRRQVQAASRAKEIGSAAERN